MSRNVYRLKKDWKFARGVIENANEASFDDSSWRDVIVPHDWAIEGPFSPDNDRQVTAVIADGITIPKIHEGRTGGLPFSGQSWYRTTIKACDPNKKYALRFDGAMNHSQVYVNGTLVGGRPYGYTSFSLDISDVVKSDAENVIAVSLTPKDFASRWYPGAGLYRNVYLVETNPVHIAYNGTYVVSEVNDDVATVTVKCDVENMSGTEKAVTIKNVVTKNGEEIASSQSDCTVAKLETVEQKIVIEGPELWDIENPELYTLTTYVVENGDVCDEYDTTFGIRTILFDREKGFFLNGKHVKLKGVCMHHDLGALGSAVNKSAVRRQMEIMQSMGCNSIRTSHNPPCVELLDICDEMGLVVLDEAFDEWRVPKVDNGYAEDFDKWGVDDISLMVKRDRNHPCIIMWSIGNEILDQHIPQGAQTAKMLSDVCHEIDPTRPTTAGFNTPEPAIENGLCDAVDIPGFNYKPHQYKQFHDEHPTWILYGSETESTVSSRGEYYFPVEERFVKDDVPKIVIEGRNHISSFDMEGPQWAYSPEREFAAQDDYDFVLGEYVWTGFDYIGEPTPFRHHWPSHASYFGIVDKAGIPKDRFYSYQAKWNEDKEVLHVFPHWNWAETNQEILEVHCYASPVFEYVEMFINGVSQGIKTRNPANEHERYRFIFKDVKFEAGQLKVVAYYKDGKIGKEQIVNTAGDPYRVELTPERKIISADGEDLCFVKVAILDKDGNVCPWAENRVDFEVSGAGKYVAADEGDQCSLRIFSEPYCNAFHGLCMAIVGAGEEAGEIKITATSEGLQSATATVIVK